MEIISLGHNRELFVDDYMLERNGGGSRVVHRPEAGEPVIFHDTVADSVSTSYYSILFNGEKYIMFYTAHGFGLNKAGNWPHQHICRGESADGVHWEKPACGIYEFKGSRENNIVLLYDDDILDNFYAIYDTNPACREEERYKAIGERVENGVAVLHGWVSPDSIHWNDIGTIMTKGTFDSMNTLYYDSTIGKYRAFVRGWRHHSLPRHLGESTPNEATSDDAKEVRTIYTATSDDFRLWSEPEPLRFTNENDYQMYTNNIAPYYRAPQILFGFPTRYYERTWKRCHELLPRGSERAKNKTSRGNTAFSDTVFMTSRDGKTFHRFDDVPLFPAGTEDKSNWVYGDGYSAHGMVETDCDRLGEGKRISMFAPDTNINAVRRYTIRLDGFVSLHIGSTEGEIITKPFVFDGSALEFNYTTTAAGYFFVELADEYDNPLEGFSYSDADELFGDTVSRCASWNGNTDLSSVSGKTVKLHIRAKECDFYSFVFTGNGGK